jgi:hypothetical protein
MLNPEAMLLVMLAGDPASIDMAPDETGCRYERLFALRNAVATAVNLDGDIDAAHKAANQALDLLEEEFSEQVEDEDLERAVEIISGLYLNPREIDDLSESEIAAIEDSAVCAGFARTLMRSYGIDLSDDPRWLRFLMRYRKLLA